MAVRLVQSKYDSFDDFYASLESAQARARTSEEIAELIAKARDYSKSSGISDAEKQRLLELRNKLYVAKRVLPAEHVVTAKPVKKKNQERKMKPQVVTTSIVKQEQTTTFSDGIQNYFAKIDSERLIGTLIAKTPVLLATIAVGVLLYMQSVDLYRSSGFDNAEVVALSGLAMVAGFATLYAVRGGLLALLCCLYMAGYETYFIASGTVSDERASKMLVIDRDEKLAWHKDNVAYTKANYQRYSSRYEDPESKVFQKPWYKKDYVDKAWSKYESASNSLGSYQSSLIQQVSFDHTGWLKILYRLGLVFLCMMLSHGMMKRMPRKATSF